MSTLVTTWLSNIAFHLQSIWLQTLVAIDSESRLTSFPRFCAPPSEVAVLFDSNLSRLPFLGQVVDLDLLLCTGFDSEHAVSFLCHISTQRPMNDRKMERSDWRGFGQQQLAQSIENFISQNSHEKKGDLSRPEIYKSLNLCWLLNWVSIARVVGYFPQASRTSAGRGPQRLPPTLKRPVFTRSSDPPKLCRSAAPRARQSWHWFCSQNLRLSSGTEFGSNCQMSDRGSNLNSNLNSAAWS